MQARGPTAAQPELVGRYADDEIWVVQVPRGNQNGQESDEDSFLDRATTARVNTQSASAPVTAREAMLPTIACDVHRIPQPALELSQHPAVQPL